MREPPTRAGPEGRPSRPEVESRPSPIGGTGVFARRALRAGDVVLTLDLGRVVDEAHPLEPGRGEREAHLAHLGPGRTVLLPEPERHLNHRCDPNAYLSSAGGQVRVVARRPVPAGEEITLDYLINTHGGSRWTCACGAERCRGELESGFFELPDPVCVEYLPLLEQWFIDEHPEAVSRLRARAAQLDPDLVPPTPLATSRCVLRAWAGSDAPLAKAALDASLPELQRWIPWALEEPTPLPDVEERLEGFREDFFGLGDAVYAIFDAGQTEVAGGIGLHRRVGPGALEIGYWIRSDLAGRGLATEAAAALSRSAFGMSGVHRLEIHCDPQNHASRAIPRKLGFRRREVLEASFEWPGEAARDTEIWELTLGEFRDRETLPS